MVQIVGKAPLEWGTVLHLPISLRKYTHRLEKWPFLWKCPFGCFIGMVVTVVPRYQTRNIPIEYVRQPKGAITGLMRTPTRSRGES